MSGTTSAGKVRQTAGAGITPKRMASQGRDPLLCFIGVPRLDAALDWGNFVAALHEAKGLRAAAPADRATLLRRLKYDLPDDVAAARVAVVHPDGKRVISAGRDSKIRVWDASTGKFLSAWEAYDFDEINGWPSALAR
jgi:hypothetical protein